MKTEAEAQAERDAKRPKVALNDLGTFLSRDVLPEIYGDRMAFALIIFPFGSADGQSDYVSNADRKDMITALKEFISQAEGMTAPVPETPQ